MDFARYLGALDEAGYQGWISLEYRPTLPDPFSWIAEFADGAH
ncbi:Hydroxypyruvate isomerase [Mycobacteroides abscessus subsp. abscessus]|nr:Hydroxypyruvate isomerase [Mycobacteroides abscessus subsp. abscessus]